MRFLGNVTHLKLVRHDLMSSYGLILPDTVFNPRGACALASVVGIGELETPIKAGYEVGDLIIFQKAAAIGVPYKEVSDLKVNNIDIAAKVVDGNVQPVDDYVLCEFISGDFVTGGGIIISRDIYEYKNFATVIRVGPSCREVQEGDEIVLDLLTGSSVMTDSEYKISSTITGGFKTCLLYKEKSILAKRG